MVEAALVVPLLALLVFGVIDFGNAFNDYISLRQGTREGARQAVVANFGAGGCALNLSGTVATETQNLLCLVKDRVGLNRAVAVRVRFDPAGDANYVAGNGVVVCTSSTLHSLTGIFSPMLDGRTMKTRVEMRIEQASSSPLGGARFAEGGEVDPSGSNWGWC